MRTFLLFIVLNGIIMVSAAQSQYQLDSTYGEKYQAADKKLNTMYQEILKEYATDTAFIRNLKISERIWLQLRDAELKMKYPNEGRPGWNYGSVQPMCEAIYLTQLTEERINTLEVWINGIEEGDVCAGSVKQKTKTH